MNWNEMTEDQILAIYRGLEPIDDAGTCRPIERVHVLSLINEVLRLRAKEKIACAPSVPSADSGQPLSEPVSMAIPAFAILDVGSVDIEPEPKLSPALNRVATTVETPLANFPEGVRLD